MPLLLPTYLLPLLFICSTLLYSEPLSKNLTRSFRPLPSINSERRSGNADHPAHKLRHVVCPPETQNLAETEALCQFGQLTKHTADDAIERSKLKAARLDPSFKENRSVHSGTALRRRRTTEDVPAGSHAPPAKKPALRIRATDSRLCSGYPRRMHDSPMEEDEPIAGPSRPLLRRPSLTSYVNAAEDSDEEDDGMPSSTPTPPPKQRAPQRRVASSSSPSLSSLSKGKYAAFSESPTSLNHVPLARRHSEDPSISYDSAPDDSISPIEHQSGSQRSIEEVPLSPVVPSPVSLSKHPANIMPPPPVPAQARPSEHPPASSSTHSQSSFSQSSRLPPNMYQSTVLSKQFAVPSSSQAAGASTSQRARSSRAPEQPQRELGMRRRYGEGGGGRYREPDQRPKTIKPWKAPSRMPVPAAAAGAGSAGIAVVARESGIVAVQSQGSLSPVVPDPPFAIARAQGFVGSIMANGGEAPQLEMSARRAEPSDDMDQDETGKEADSSYGDVSFDFDPDALDEAMSMYDA